MYKTSLKWFSSVIEILKTMIFSPCAQLQISKLQNQPKIVSVYRDPIKWYYVFSSDDVEEDGLSEITKSTSKTKPSKSYPSSFWHSTQMTRWSVSTKSWPTPVRVFWHNFSGLDGKSIAYYANQILLSVIPVILKKLMRD